MENASRLYHVTRDNAFCYHLAHNMGEFDNDMALWYEWVRQYDRVKKSELKQVAEISEPITSILNVRKIHGENIWDILYDHTRNIYFQIEYFLGFKIDNSSV